MDEGLQLQRPRAAWRAQPVSTSSPPVRARRCGRAWSCPRMGLAGTQVPWLPCVGCRLRQAHQHLRVKLQPYLTEARFSFRLLLNLLASWLVFDPKRQTYVDWEAGAAAAEALQQEWREQAAQQQQQAARHDLQQQQQQQPEQQPPPAQRTQATDGSSSAAAALSQGGNPQLTPNAP